MPVRDNYTGLIVRLALGLVVIILDLIWRKWLIAVRVIVIVSTFIFVLIWHMIAGFTFPVARLFGLWHHRVIMKSV
mgnify:CR=1 FL=1